MKIWFLNIMFVLKSTFFSNILYCMTFYFSLRLFTDTIYFEEASNPFFSHFLSLSVLTTERERGFFFHIFLD